MGGIQRVMAIVMTVLTVGFGGLWVLGYMYITAMACAFVTSSAGCSVKMPWNLTGEDLQVLVLIPGAVFLVLLVVTILLWRSKLEASSET